MQVEIKDLLKKFVDLLKNEDLKKTFVQEVIKKNLNIEIPLEKIRIKKDTVYLDLSPIEKNEVFLFQSSLVKEINLNLKEIRKLG